jgi:hypothetical protein
MPHKKLRPPPGLPPSDGQTMRTRLPRSRSTSSKRWRVTSQDGSLSPEQQRRFETLGRAVDEACAGDRRFFEVHHWRQHLVRRATQAEVEQAEILTENNELPEEAAVFIAVKNVAAGLRIRSYFVSWATNDPNCLSEGEAREIYETHANSRARLLETQMQAAAARRGLQ